MKYISNIFLGEINTIIDGFSTFLVQNEEPSHHTIVIFILSSILISTLLFTLLKLLFLVRQKDLLGISVYGSTNLIRWVSGSTIFGLLLYLLGIIQFNIMSLVVISFFWDKIFEQFFYRLQKNEEFYNVETIKGN